MLINHPILGQRDAAEFIYIGDAILLDRPHCPLDQPIDAQMVRQFHDYVYLRDNIAGVTKELWYHEQGDRSYLVINRNTLTHEIISVEMAHEYAQNLHEAKAGKDKI